MKNKRIISVITAAIIICSMATVNGADNDNLSEIIFKNSDAMISDSAIYVDDKSSEGGYGAVPSIINYTDNDGVFNLGTATRAALPTKYTSPYVTKVKDQYNTSNCWVFASIATLESNIMKDIGYSNPNFSEEHARQAIYGSRSWHDTSEYKYRVIGNANSAGNQEYVSRYVLRGEYYGPAEEDNNHLFYIVGNIRTIDELNLLSPIKYYPKTTIKLPYFNTNSYTESELENRISQIKSAIYQSGGVVTLMPFYQAGIQYIYNYDIGGPEYYHNIEKDKYDYVMNNSDLMHCIEIIGWDDSVAISNFSKPPSRNGAFLIKNSWGGKYSYVYISYDNVDLMQDIMYFDDFVNRNTFDNLYEHDHITTLCPEYNSKSKKMFVSKFNKKTNKTEKLTSVNLDILDAGTKFKVYVSSTGNFEDLTPVNLSNAIVGSSTDNKIYTKNASGNFTVDLAEPVSLSGSNFLIGVEYINSSAVCFVTERACFLDPSAILLECRPVINIGETYIYNSGSINSQSSYTDTATLSTPYNTCFKAYTKN